MDINKIINISARSAALNSPSILTFNMARDCVCAFIVGDFQPFTSGYFEVRFEGNHAVHIDSLNLLKNRSFKDWASIVIEGIALAGATLSGNALFVFLGGIGLWMTCREMTKAKYDLADSAILLIAASCHSADSTGVLKGYICERMQNPKFDVSSTPIDPSSITISIDSEDCMERINNLIKYGLLTINDNGNLMLTDDVILPEGKKTIADNCEQGA